VRRTSLRETGGRDGWSSSTESGLQACYGKAPQTWGFSICSQPGKSAYEASDGAASAVSPEPLDAGARPFAFVAVPASLSIARARVPASVDGLKSAGREACSRRCKRRRWPTRRAHRPSERRLRLRGCHGLSPRQRCATRIARPLRKQPAGPRGRVAPRRRSRPRRPRARFRSSSPACEARAPTQIWRCAPSVPIFSSSRANEGVTKAPRK
jgi:hypothetical protein